MTIQSALNSFLVKASLDIESKSHQFADHMNYSDTDSDAYFQPLSTTTGKKNIKVWMTSGTSKSIYCFINIESGDIFKPAGINAPAKGVRGNVHDKSTYEPHDLSDGGWLYRNRY